MLITRGYKPEDINRLYELEKLCFTRAFRWRKEDLVAALKTDDIWVGVYDDKIVGYVLVEGEGETGHIISLNVDPNYRRRGFGEALMGAAEAYYLKKGIKKMKLEVHVDNPAQILYFKMGYRTVGVQEGYYANGSSAIVMTKCLKKST